MNKITTQVLHVTPEIAEAWLGTNSVNRTVKKNRVGSYARDMRDGNWHLTGEAIKLSSAGRLLDGQHRCMAIVEADVTVPMVVIMGVDEQAQSVMDSGVSRTPADDLAMRGHRNSQTVAAIARRRVSPTDFGSVTRSEIYDYVDANPEIEFAADIGKRYARKSACMSAVAIGLATWLIAEVHDWMVADEFFNAAVEKVGLLPGDPVLAMERFFIEARRLHRQLPMDVQLSVIIRAFNYRIQGQTWRYVKVASQAKDGGNIPIPPVVRLKSDEDPES